jgi:WD40 repeat protein
LGCIPSLLSSALCSKRLLVVIFCVLAVLSVVVLWYGWGVASLPEPTVVATWTREGSDEPITFAVSSDGSLLALTQPQMTICDLATGATRPLAIDGNVRNLEYLTFSADNRLLALGTALSEVLLCDATNARTLHHLPLVGHWGRDLFAFTPDGKELIGIGDPLWKIERYEPSTGIRIGTFGPAGYDVYQLVVSGDGQYVATFGGSQRVHVLRGPPYQDHVTITTSHGAVDAVVFTANSKRIVTGGNDGIHVWDTATGELCAKLSCQRVNSLAMSPDHRILAAGCGEVPAFVREWPGRVELWNMENFKLLSSWKAHESRVLAVAFCLGGTNLITTNGGTVKQWDLRPCLPEGGPNPK